MIKYLIPVAFGFVLGGCRPPIHSVESTPSPTHATWQPTFMDVAGAKHRPFDHPDTQAIAMVFVLPDCPISNSYLPELNRLNQTFRPRGVFFLLVHADSDLTSELAQQHAFEYQIQFPVVLDPSHNLVHRAGATTTPEAAVFARTGDFLYRGRINNQYMDLGRRRAQVTSHDLRDALEATLAGRPPTSQITEAVGCYIPDLDIGGDSHD